MTEPDQPYFAHPGQQQPEVPQQPQRPQQPTGFPPGGVGPRSALPQQGPGYPGQQGQQAHSGPVHPGAAQPGPAGWSSPQQGNYPGQQPHYGAQQQRVRQGKRARIGFGSTLLVLVLALAAGGTGGYFAGQSSSAGGSKVVEVPVVSGPAGSERPNDSVAGIAQAVTPSVVSLEVVDGDSYATGSGFIFSEDGYIVTNNHVVAAAEGARITVMLADGSQEPATVVGATIDYDIAVVKIERSGLEPLTLGDSDAVVVGDPVIAIGAPLGLDGTVTTGIVSAMNRPVIAGGNADTAFINAIQTDAAINPGNSGGPLVNGSGEVIGINSAIAQPPGSAQATGSIGLGFSIPSNQAKRTATELIETGSATYPLIGVLLDQRYDGEGVMVLRNPPQGETAVTPNSAAERAGLASGDVIVAIDGRPVTEPNELIVAIRAKAPGDAVVLTIRPEGLDTESELRMVLDEAVSN